ncbi:MAG TPA: DNA translocase FtsK 4TM domain-containing protein, partial [Sphingomicrobium sp.]
MATVAARAPKRDLAPDWRDALRASLSRFAVRSWGALLLALSLAGAVALASHSANDPSLSTAAGGPPRNWLGSPGAYGSDALL